jgi:hypothetical protein
MPLDYLIVRPSSDLVHTLASRHTVIRVMLWPHLSKHVWAQAMPWLGPCFAHAFALAILVVERSGSGLLEHMASTLFHIESDWFSSSCLLLTQTFFSNLQNCHGYIVHATHVFYCTCMTHSGNTCIICVSYLAWRHFMNRAMCRTWLGTYHFWLGNILGWLDTHDFSVITC